MTGPVDGAGDCLHRLEVALARDREAGLDVVDAETGELLGDLELLHRVEGDARGLLTVPQGRVEDDHLVAHQSLRPSRRTRVLLLSHLLATSCHARTRPTKNLLAEGAGGGGEREGALAVR